MKVKTHGLSKFTHVAMILEDPPKKLVEEIENMISRFIQAGNYRTRRIRNTQAKRILELTQSRMAQENFLESELLAPTTAGNQQKENSTNLLE